ncbi:GGDEF domain-containing protein [Ideonella sp. A 288]|uniref:GGDEF domain-containing protein n=1 Tax=Ideonella sp. A 288 TaxID=1962181 RepID=UPI0013031B56|nr:GGDEF domain-containing protein [Ideonella sp. A 288]
MEPADSPASTHDALLGLRGSITARVGLIAFALILPFSVYHVTSGRYSLAAVDLLAAVLFGGNAWSLMARGRPLVPYIVLATSILAAVVASVHFIGAPPLYWAFPASMYFYMVLPRRQAHLFCLLLVAGSALIGYFQFGGPTSLRFVGSAGLMLVLLNVVLGVIGELQQQLVTQSVTDPLTGAFNRRDLQAALQRLTSAKAPRRAVLLLFDIDHFKAVNDRHGHAVGDQVLRDVVALAQSCVRGTDRLFRVGGEEFVLVLDGITVDAAMHVAEELRQRIEQAPLLDDQPVTVSLGVSPLVAGFDPDRWLHSADSAMYEAKREGRNCVRVAL